MSPVAATLTDDDMHNLGAYFASLTPAAPPATAAGKAVVETGHCAHCHGEGFLGARAAARGANPREDYLVKALADYRRAKRQSQGVGAVADAATSLTGDDIAAAAHYLSRLPAAP